jgi:hypothetical protein
VTEPNKWPTSAELATIRKLEISALMSTGRSWPGNHCVPDAANRQRPLSGTASDYLKAFAYGKVGVAARQRAAVPVAKASAHDCLMWIPAAPETISHGILLTSILVIRSRNTRIAPRATAVLAEEPIQVRGTVLHIFAKILDVGASEITEE